MAEQNQKGTNWTPIIVAVISGMVALIVGYWQFGPKSPTSASQQIEYVGRVVDSHTSAPVNGAKVTLDFQGIPPVTYTDSEGVFRFTISFSGDQIAGGVIIDAPGYEPYSRNVTLFSNKKSLEDIRLSPKPLAINGTTPTSIPATVPPQVVIVTATSIPTLSCSLPNFFENIWRSHSQLGCPTNSMTSDFTFQYYERGIMAWQKSPSPSTIYAFFNDGRWERQTDPGGPETPPCREAQIIGRPIRGYGTLWCNNEDWRQRLGVPTSDENDGGNKQIQIFQNGTVFTVGTAGGFILYSNSRWERF